MKIQDTVPATSKKDEGVSGWVYFGWRCYFIFKHTQRMKKIYVQNEEESMYDM